MASRIPRRDAVASYVASFIGVAHPNLCSREYVSPTDKACWKEDCNDGSVETPQDYERDSCSPIP